MNRAIVLLSGGLDSAVCLFDTVYSGEFSHIDALSFDYGQRHRQEITRAEGIVETAKSFRGAEIVHTIIEAPRFPVWSALTHGGDLKSKTARNPRLPASFVPGRNLLLITLAAMFGYDRRASVVIIGANEIDFSGYPDCRQGTLRLVEAAIRTGFDWPDFVVRAPLIRMSKASIFERAEMLGVLDFVVASTLSCYEGDETAHPWGHGCGLCPSCRIRAAGWHEFRKAHPVVAREP